MRDKRGAWRSDPTTPWPGDGGRRPGSPPCLRGRSCRLPNQRLRLLMFLSTREAGGRLGVLEVLVRGVSCGAMLALGVGMVGVGGRNPARWAGAGFCLSVAAFAVHSGGAETEALGVIRPLVWVMSAGAVAWFWLFAVSLFEDRKFTWSRLWPVVGMVALAGVAESLSGAAADGVWITHNLLEIVLVGHVITVILRNWRGDLVTERLSLRAPFLAVLAIYAIGLSLSEILLELGILARWEGLAQATTLAILALLASGVLLRPGLYAAVASVRPATPDAVPIRDRPAIDKLKRLMEDDEAWRREGLTIVALSAMLNLPEHRLRRLINMGLGYRNFAAFLNHYRVEAAKRALADQERAREAVSSLAFDLGYGSLGPFNRAFKEATGVTPRAWREASLAGSPISEEAG